ncbi:MAG: hypothetical protein U0V74_00350 [Chitinophagales bacterium]
MKKLLLAFLLLQQTVFAQSTFEGSLSISFKNEKNATTQTDVKVKGAEVYIKQSVNGNAKYDHFVINLKTRELYTVSAASKKVIIKYQLDSLLAFYERENLKEGFVRNFPAELKLTDKAIEKDGVRQTKFVAETNLLKITGWVSDAQTPINDLIPFLRLINSWNEAQGGNIIEAETTYKVGKRESSVKVTVKKEAVTKETFELPKGYETRDFAKMMEEQRGNKELKTIVQTFGEF